MTKDLFFSIIIPAHNEEKYIQPTLKHLEELEYPKELYEVIVVENGSSDETYERAKTLASSHVKVFQIPESGVSKARNFGSAQVNQKSDWVFFLDADTFPDPPFLRTISNFLQSHANHNYAVGTASLRAYPSSPVMDFIYGGTNFFFKMRGAAFGGALFVRRPLLDVVHFDEDLQMGEDEVFAKKLEAFGPFFFFSTNLVHTSTRRYQNGGWKKIPVWIGIWLFAMIIPPHAKFTATFQRRLKYKVVR